MIFFDLDDTLMDFKKAEYLAIQAFYNQFLDKFNQTEDQFYEDWCKVGLTHFERFLRGELTYEQQKIERMIGLLSGTDIDINPDSALDYFQIYLNHFEDNWHLFNDVISCLESLKDHRLGIITNGDSVQQRQKLKSLGILDYFQVIVVSGDIGVSKPNPEIFIQACKLAQVQPTECFFIGDSMEADVQACEKINMNGIWLNRKHSGLKHKRTITSLSELKPWFESEFGQAGDIL